MKPVTINECKKSTMTHFNEALLFTAHAN